MNNKNIALIMIMVGVLGLGIGITSIYYTQYVVQPLEETLETRNTALQSSIGIHKMQSFIISNKHISFDTYNDTKHLLSNTYMTNQRIANEVYGNSNILKNCTIIKTTTPLHNISVIVTGNYFVNCTLYGNFDETNYLLNCTEETK